MPREKNRRRNERRACLTPSPPVAQEIRAEETRPVDRKVRRSCTDRMIFMSPLEVRDCPSDIKRCARVHPDWAAKAK